jgi:hypothetical protein
MGCFFHNIAFANPLIRLAPHGPSDFRFEEGADTGQAICDVC